MINTEEKDKLLNLLFSSYQILKNSDSKFANLLYVSYQKINKGEDYKIICSKISGACNHYILQHIHYVPKPVGELNNLVQEISKRYRLKIGSIFNDPLYKILDNL